MIVIAAGLALAVTLPAIQARAAAARTFISAAGSDSNNCTNVATPCRHLAAAFAATAQDGEIYVLDPANYGSLTITHGVSIEGHGWASIAPVSGGNAITISANPGDAINIVGVVLDGTALAGTNGIVFSSGGSLTLADSVVRNFTQTGVYIGPGSSMNLLISNTRVSDNAVAGIDLAPQQIGLQNGAEIFFAIDHVTANGNGYGIFMNSAVASGANVGTITNSIFSSNNSVGIDITSSTGLGANNVAIKDTTVTNTWSGNPAAGISVSNAGGPGSNVTLSHSMVSENNIGILIGAGGAVFSAGNNDITTGNNTSISGGSLTPSPEQ